MGARPVRHEWGLIGGKDDGVHQEVAVLDLRRRWREALRGKTVHVTVLFGGKVLLPEATPKQVFDLAFARELDLPEKSKKPGKTKKGSRRRRASKVRTPGSH